MSHKWALLLRAAKEVIFLGEWATVPYRASLFWVSWECLMQVLIHMVIMNNVAL